MACHLGLWGSGELWLKEDAETKDRNLSPPDMQLTGIPISGLNQGVQGSSILQVPDAAAWTLSASSVSQVPGFPLTLIHQAPFATILIQVGMNMILRFCLCIIDTEEQVWKVPGTK